MKINEADKHPKHKIIKKRGQITYDNIGSNEISYKIVVYKIKGTVIRSQVLQKPVKIRKIR